MKTLSIHLILSVILSSYIFAEEKKEPLTTGFRTLGWFTSVDDIYYLSGGKDVPVKVYQSARSQFYEYNKEEKIEFYRLKETPEGEMTREIIATAHIQVETEMPLIIFIPEGKDSVRAFTVADDLKNFPAPYIRFVNPTAVDMGLSVGKEKKILKAKSIININPKLKGDGSKTETRFTTISIDTENGPKRIYSNNWAIRPNQRNMVLILPRDGRLNVQRIVDDKTQYMSVVRLEGE
jgi:hypothetical protein